VWPDATGAWQQETAVIDNVSHDCLSVPPTAQGQVCNEAATRYRIVDAAMGPGGAVRWLAIVTTITGTYTSSCGGGPGPWPDAGGCSWSPSAGGGQSQSLAIGALQAGSLTFTPVAGPSWSNANGQDVAIARDGTAIDSAGAIHVGYAVSAWSSGAEVHHLVVTP
jgi:hypothetical protein